MLGVATNLNTQLGARTLAAAAHLDLHLQQQQQRRQYSALYRPTLPPRVQWT